MLTQDATYLCNKLDVEALPQSSYPFFHIRMEDVWVWDKTGRAGSAPCRGVHLGRRHGRGAPWRGGEPLLTAEDLAERIGQPLSGDDDVALTLDLHVLPQRSFRLQKGTL